MGLPTLILGSALDILKAGQPPRVSFINYPLGFETGRFKDPQDQLKVVREGLRGFQMTKPDVLELDFDWPEGWEMINAREAGKLDQRSARTTEPQYQNEADRLAAETRNRN